MLRLKVILQSKVFLIISFFLIALYVLVFTQILKSTSKYSLTSTNLSGIITDYHFFEDKLSLTIKAQEKVQVNYYFDIKEITYLKDKIKIGLEVDLTGKFKEPINNTIPNTFNYKKYLLSHKIYRTFTAKKIEIKNNSIKYYYQIKNWFLKRISKYTKTKDYLKAFILGDKNDLNEEIYNDYKTNGITHLFAVSGMHLSFLIFFLNIIFSKLKVKEFTSNIIIIIFLGFYMFLIGFSFSIVRASIFYIALLFNKKYLKLSSVFIWYLVLLLLLIINPFSLYDIGFLYSNICTLGLIIFKDKIKGKYWQKLLKVSFIAWIFSLPITILNFYEINLLTILANLIIVPLVSVIIFPLTILTFIFPFLESILAFTLNNLEMISEFLIKFKIMVVIPKFNISLLLFYFIIIYLIFKKGFKYSLLLILFIMIVKAFPYMDNKDYVYFLDVGQGDSSLIITKHQKEAILIDTGGIVSNSKTSQIDNVITFLKSLGITKIDYLIASHGDYDHIGFASKLVLNIKVNKLIFNIGEFNNVEKDLINILQKKNIRYYQNLQSLNLSDLKLLFLNTKLYDNENDNSNVIWFKLNNYSFLYMGDASTKKEGDILATYNLKNIDFLKVGHHGSNTSTDECFIDVIKPKYAIISVGRNNIYGHPNFETLNNLKNSQVFRTDINGTIKISFSKKGYILNNYPP